MEAADGGDIGGNVLALFSGDGEADSAVLIAQATAPSETLKLADADPGPIPGDEAKIARRQWRSARRATAEPGRRPRYAARL